MKKYPVVALCGSTRFKEEFLEEQKRLTLEGNVVISVGLFGHSGDNEVWENMPEDTKTETKHMLDDIHKQKIDMADCIYVINPGGYIGKSTWSEISYAWMTGKKIRSLEPIPDSDIRQRIRDRMDAAEGFALQRIEILKNRREKADMDMHPYILHEGQRIFDPWLSPDDNRSDDIREIHEDPEKKVDPFKTYGKKKAAKFIEELLYLYGKNDFY